MVNRTKIPYSLLFGRKNGSDYYCADGSGWSDWSSWSSCSEKIVCGAPREESRERESERRNSIEPTRCARADGSADACPGSAYSRVRLLARRSLRPMDLLLVVVLGHQCEVDDEDEHEKYLTQMQQILGLK